MKSFVSAWIWCLIVASCQCFGSDLKSALRQFASSATNFRIFESNTIYIPCYLNFMENTSTVWYRNGQILTTSRNDFTDTPLNILLEPNHKLKISNAKVEDSGEYTCEIFYADSEQPLRQNHFVNVIHLERQFVSTTTNFRIIENSTIYIPCHLNYMENTTTVWFRNGQKIADSTLKFGDKPLNIHFETNYTLKVSSIKRTDGGEYSCEIRFPESDQPVRQNHLVDVLYPPVVSPDPDSGGKDIELMHGFALTCDVAGNPMPKIKWYFENKEMPLNNDHLVTFNVSRAVKEHEGEYRCVADNAIGNSVSATFQIRILFYPEVTAVREWIHGAVDLKIELACKVLANPRPKVSWLYEGELLNKSSKFSTRIEENEYFLIVRNLKLADFGIYTCQATNFLGRNFAKIEVSGLANPAVFKADPRKRTENSYTLIWEVDSYSPPFQYQLKFRKQQRGDSHGQWLPLVIPASIEKMGPIHTETYTLAGLESATVYEAIITSKNVFGWSKPSQIFKFSTVGIEYDVPQVTEKSIITSTGVLDLEVLSTEEYQREDALSQTDAASSIIAHEVPLLVISIVLYLL